MEGGYAAISKPAVLVSSRFMAAPFCVGQSSFVQGVTPHHPLTPPAPIAPGVNRTLLLVHPYGTVKVPVARYSRSRGCRRAAKRGGGHQATSGADRTASFRRGPHLAILAVVERRHASSYPPLGRLPVTWDGGSIELQGWESNPLAPSYEPGEVTMPLPCGLPPDQAAAVPGHAPGGGGMG